MSHLISFGIGKKLSSSQELGLQRGPQVATRNRRQNRVNTNLIAIQIINIQQITLFSSMFKKRNKNSQVRHIDLDQIQQNETQGAKDDQKNQVQEEIGALNIKKKQQTNNIGGTTNTRKAETDQATHQKFQFLNYKKGDEGQIPQGEILAGDQAAETETELARRKYLENVEITKKIKEGKIDSKIYRGANNYANYRLTQSDLENPKESYKWKHGPTRAKGDANKSSCRFDYDPSLCKDFHDCGYCVFGNSCIYLHDRSNYKTGWELEKDFERAERQRWRRINNPDVNQEPDYIKDLQKFKPQQKCQYCSQNLQNAVQISCRHIFCMKCATQMEQKDKKCILCGKKMDGIMNNAQKSLRKQKQQYEEMLKMTEKSKQTTASKRSKYRGLNSLDVFTANG